MIIIGVVMYYSLTIGAGSSYQTPDTLEKIKIEDEKKKKEQQEEMIKAYNEQFPDLVEGIISIVSNEKTTIETKDKKKYLIWPVRPVSFYKDSGIKDGEMVEIRGKILENGRISLGSVVGVEN